MNFRPSLCAHQWVQRHKLTQFQVSRGKRTQVEPVRVQLMHTLHYRVNELSACRHDASCGALLHASKAACKVPPTALSLLTMKACCLVGIENRELVPSPFLENARNLLIICRGCSVAKSPGPGVHLQHT